MQGQTCCVYAVLSPLSYPYAAPQHIYTTITAQPYQLPCSSLATWPPHSATELTQVLSKIFAHCPQTSLRKLTCHLRLLGP
jgi:hypothetical protein